MEIAAGTNVGSNQNLILRANVKLSLVTIVIQIGCQLMLIFHLTPATSSTELRWITGVKYYDYAFKPF